jgi:hypothetical protein
MKRGSGAFERLFQNGQLPIQLNVVAFQLGDLPIVLAPALFGGSPMARSNFFGI